jgi:uncharacterized protein (DUF58 family)
MNNKITPLGYLLIATFFILLSYASWLYTKSIDWDVLKRMEKSPISLPGPITPTLSTASATPTVKNN